MFNPAEDSSEPGPFKGLSVQLYSLREESALDFDAVLAGVAAQGYQGVELFQLFGKSPREFTRRVEGLGLQISSSHLPWGTTTDPRKLADTLSELGLRRAIGGFMPDDVATEAALAATIDKTNAIVDALASEGMTLALHNHWWEFRPITDSANKELIHHRLQRGCPDVEFQLDAYWAANFGTIDPAAELARVARRTPLLHLKDGPLIKGEPMVALGQGKLPVARILGAAEPNVLEWIVVELDECSTNMSEAIGASQQFLDNLLHA